MCFVAAVKIRYFWAVGYQHGLMISGRDDGLKLQGIYDYSQKNAFKMQNVLYKILAILYTILFKDITCTNTIKYLTPQMENTIYPLHKKTRHIGSPPQYLRQPTQIAYYRQPRTQNNGYYRGFNLFFKKYIIQLFGFNC